VQPLRTSTSVTRSSPRSGGIQRPRPGRCWRVLTESGTTPAPRCCLTGAYSLAAAESARPASAQDIWRRTSSTSSRPTAISRTQFGSSRHAGEQRWLWPGPRQRASRQHDSLGGRNSSEAIGTAAKAGSVQLFTSTGSTITPGTGLTQDTHRRYRNGHVR
jgi:hypothetical protein